MFLRARWALEFSHGLREAVFLFQERARLGQVNAAGRPYAALRAYLRNL